MSNKRVWQIVCAITILTSFVYMACPDIDHCERKQCNSPDNTTCLKCYDDDVFFLRTHSDTRCERMCAWNNYYCWPGECSNRTAVSCRCASGFHYVKSSNETICQLEPNTIPTISSCDMQVIGPNREMKQASNTSSLTDCSDLTDFYGNFNPIRVICNVSTEFIVNVTWITKPAYIYDSKFGITDVSLGVEVLSIKGTRLQQNIYSLFTGNAESSDIGSDSCNFDISFPTLSDGQRFCLSYEAYGGGFLRSLDLAQVNPVPSAPVPYTKSNATRRLCYRYDSSPPEHCQIDNSCMNIYMYEPLQIQVYEVVTKYDSLMVQFDGWRDPVPFGGNSDYASGIESYQITAHEVPAANDVLKVGTKAVFTKMADSSVTWMTVNLPPDSPKLYAIYLTVKDVADNAKQSRRFVLFDNSSRIEVRPDKSFFVESASPQTNYTWQTHHGDICLNWINHFYNKIYIDNPFLNPVEPDPSGIITGVYEQRTGLLPVTGTPNVNGIVEFKTSWSLNYGTNTSETTVKNFQSQRYCNNFSVADGQTYTINIRAVDIARNDYTEKRTVHIDRSPPHVNDIWLVKDGYNSALLHSKTDLSQMYLHFEAMDPHSGIKELEWAFVLSDSEVEVATGNIATNMADEDCPPSRIAYDNNCYCPDIGKCEFYRYNIPVSKLLTPDKHIHIHNRSYFFIIKATNHALLFKEGFPDFGADESRPYSKTVTGIVIGVLIATVVTAIALMVKMYWKTDTASRVLKARSGLSEHAYKGKRRTAILKR